MTFSEEFLSLVQKTRHSPQEICLEELIKICRFEEKNSLLEIIPEIDKMIKILGLSIIPPLKVGTISESRLLKINIPSRKFESEQFEEILLTGENFGNEFKSSLLCDIKRKQFQTNATLEELRSEKVLHSSLKSIAGIMNWNGGKLLIGVDDEGKMVGIEEDFIFFKEDKKNCDGWELELRNQVNGKFYDGNIINQHLEVQFISKENKTCAVVNISQRRRLTFLKAAGQSDYFIYCRQGNSTRKIPITEIEEFIALRSKLLTFPRL